MLRHSMGTLTFIFAVFALLALAATSAAAQGPITGLKPASSDLDESKLQPGLAVRYHFMIFNHIDELRHFYRIDKGRVGEPLPMLNYHVGPGNVLTSGLDDGVGAFINGFIKFPEAGLYNLFLHSNDGVELMIGEKLIHSDPKVHPDTMTEPIPVQVDQAGWYPIQLDYFEKKRTSTLELYWQPPGHAGEPVFVPAESFAHLQE